MAEFIFRCNSLSCRRELDDQAVVTTCWCVHKFLCAVHKMLIQNPAISTVSNALISWVLLAPSTDSVSVLPVKMFWTSQTIVPSHNFDQKKTTKVAFCVVYHRQTSWNVQVKRLHSLPTRLPRRCESFP